LLNILFLSDDREDYLADSLLHGMISLGCHHVVDYPRKELLYAGSFAAEQRSQLYGHGFTLYGLLPERQVDRTLIWKRLEAGWFDLVILGNIWRQFGLLPQLIKSMQQGHTRLLLLDGDDDARLYPVSLARVKQHGLQIPGYLDALTGRICYAKRELDLQQPQHWRELLLPARLRPHLRHLFRRQLLNPKPCSFSIPAQWIRKPDRNHKTKLLPRHIVDIEVRSQLENSQSNYAFSSQQDYFDDLAEARFGITTKRAGWDCLRHYEIAAAGTVPCFRNLQQKPALCAPHGLNADNCVVYTSAADLNMQLQTMGIDHYQNLLAASHAWVQQHTTVQAAARLLQESAS
jgi:hypothetical protein